MTEKMQETLEALAEKYGTTVSGLVAEMARREIAGDVIVLIASTILLIIVVILWKHTLTLHRGRNLDSEDFGVITFLYAIPAIIIITVIIVSAVDMSNWILAPRITAIEKIVNMIK